MWVTMLRRPGAKSLFCFQLTAKKVVWSRFEIMTIVSMSLDDLDLFDKREVREATGYSPITMGAVYGFEWGSLDLCRFHHGPSVNIHYLCEEDDTDVPPTLYLEDVWAQFSGCILARSKHISAARPQGRV